MKQNQRYIEYLQNVYIVVKNIIQIHTHIIVVILNVKNYIQNLNKRRNMGIIDKVKQGKSNKRKGRMFEMRVRKQLESWGWFVAKFSNNVDLDKDIMIPAKHKFNFFSKAMTMGTGFPDFIIFRWRTCNECINPCGYEVIGVEAKTTGYLDKIEKLKVKWLLEHEVFEEIWVAYPGSGAEKKKIHYDIMKKEVKN